MLLASKTKKKTKKKKKKKIKKEKHIKKKKYDCNITKNKHYKLMGEFLWLDYKY
jgi:hypothetical protein